MQTVLSGNDVGILVLARKELLVHPQADLKITIHPETRPTQTTLWDKALKDCLELSRKGSIATMADRKNTDFQSPYPHFSTTILHHMACEGLADSVEFRRLARKEIRKAKQSNIDTLFFPEAIFGEAQTHKILQHLAGSQMKICTVADFYTPQGTNGETRNIEIIHNENETWIKQRAEAILKTKLPQ